MMMMQWLCNCLWLVEDDNANRTINHIADDLWLVEGRVEEKDNIVGNIMVNDGAERSEVS